jgi:hypothetical protein
MPIQRGKPQANDAMETPESRAQRFNGGRARMGEANTRSYQVIPEPTILSQAGQLCRISDAHLHGGQGFGAKESTKCDPVAHLRGLLVPTESSQPGYRVSVYKYLRLVKLSDNIGTTTLTLTKTAFRKMLGGHSLPVMFVQMSFMTRARLQKAFQVSQKLNFDFMLNNRLCA